MTVESGNRAKRSPRPDGAGSGSRHGRESWSSRNMPTELMTRLRHLRPHLKAGRGSLQDVVVLALKIGAAQLEQRARRRAS